MLDKYKTKTKLFANLNHFELIVIQLIKEETTKSIISRHIQGIRKQINKL